MPELEKLSTIERQWLADEKRQRLNGAIDLGLTPRPEPSAEELAQRDRENAARALPDDLFADDSEVIRLRQVVQQCIQASEGRATYRQWLTEQRSALARAMGQGEDDLQQLMLADVLGQDAGFSRTRDEINRRLTDRTTLAAMDGVLALLNQPPGIGNRLSDDVADARARLHARLQTLKREHIAKETQA